MDWTDPVGKCLAQSFEEYFLFPVTSTNSLYGITVEIRLSLCTFEAAKIYRTECIIWDVLPRYSASLSQNLLFNVVNQHHITPSQAGVIGHALRGGRLFVGGIGVFGPWQWRLIRPALAASRWRASR